MAESKASLNPLSSFLLFLGAGEVECEEEEEGMLAMDWMIWDGFLVSAPSSVMRLTMLPEPWGGDGPPVEPGFESESENSGMLKV